VNLNGIKLTNNAAGGKGGGAYIHKGQLTLYEPTAFSGNTATLGIAGAGYKANQAGLTFTITNPPPGTQAAEQDP
jgi:hypothetical protein